MGFTSKVITYTPAGTDEVHICQPMINIDESISEAAAIQRAMRRAIPPDALNVKVIKRSSLPVDRTFRDAWKVDNTSVQVDISKARELWKEKMREAREPKLRALDVEYMRADEAGDIETKIQIASQKAALRDVTADPAIASASTAEDLKAVWPEILK